MIKNEKIPREPKRAEGILWRCSKTIGISESGVSKIISSANKGREDKGKNKFVNVETNTYKNPPKLFKGLEGFFRYSGIKNDPPKRRFFIRRA